MKNSILVFGILISLNLFGQELTKKELKYIPKDFNESLIQLDKVIQDTTRAKIKLMSEDDFITQTHFSTGMWIRNYWLYNRYVFGLIVMQSDLRKDLILKGLYNNDDMSGVILRSYHRKLKGNDVDLEQQIKDIHQWYVNMNDPKWRAEQDSIAWANHMKQFNIGDTIAQHIYYERNWLGEPRKDNIIIAEIIDKTEKKIKIDIVSFGEETERNLVYEEIECDSIDCWISPYFWKNINDFEE
ncbi:hypothetical protein E9993_17855 [Labilibacter sediminis]|nr:hypothetical protein E9993_17855 [Labilibacter sediminis]